MRLGLPLASTDILRHGRIEARGRNLPAGVTLYSVGLTTLTRGTVDRWLAALPRAPARAKLKAFAVQIAAGIVAEGAADSLPAREDLYQLVQVGSLLGYGRSNANQRMRRFMVQAVAHAGRLLGVDAGRGWHRVAAALYRRRKLCGDEVRRMMRREQPASPRARRRALANSKAAPELRTAAVHA